MTTSPQPMLVLGIDTGGTFIDLAVAKANGRVIFHKQLADPTDLARSVLDGVDGLALAADLETAGMLADCNLIAHGTTIATNGVLTHTGAPTLLLTTEGLRDALEMRRGLKEDVFDLRLKGPEPLIPRRWRIGVAERLSSDGDILKPMDPYAAMVAAERAISEGALSIAICLMHAWANPVHEEALERLCHDAFPNIPVFASSSVVSQIGFYDRLSTTVITAYTAPLLETYLGDLEKGLRERGFGGALYIVGSSGGLMAPRHIRRLAARTVLSGPAVAPVAAVDLVTRSGHVDGLVVDMGGTSFDVSVVKGGRPVVTGGGEVGRLRLAFPMTRVATIPLGGGSIAHIDDSELMQVGPMSAGADPGPACFGRGGADPTITDADLLLGYIHPSDFASGQITFDAPAAREAFTKALAGSSDTDAVTAARGVFHLAGVRMADAVRRAALEEGLDYRRAPLVVAGGAGPVHACAIGRELQIDTLIVPAETATLCAVGALHLKPQLDVARSLAALLSAETLEGIETINETLVEELTTLHDGKFARFFTLDLRYRGQEETLAVPFHPDEAASKSVAAIRRRFSDIHEARHGYALDDEPIDVITVRLSASWESGIDVVTDTPSGARPVAAGPERIAYDPSSGTDLSFAVFDVDDLSPGHVVNAPAVIRLSGSTCVITHPYRCEVDSAGSLVLERIA